MDEMHRYFALQFLLLALESAHFPIVNGLISPPRSQIIYVTDRRSIVELTRMITISKKRVNSLCYEVGTDINDRSICDLIQLLLL